MSYALKTTDDLLVEFKRDAFIASQNNYTDPELLAVGDRMILEFVVPLLSALPGSWYQSFTDLTPSSLTSRVALPRYASYNTVKKVDLVLASNGSLVAELALYETSNGAFYRTASPGTPAAYELLHNEINLARVPGASDVSNYRLRVYHPRRPSRMVAVSRSTTVLTANSTSGAMTYASTPTSLTGALLFDFYGAQSPFVRKGSLVVGTAIAGNANTIPAATAALLAAGDVVCAEDETIFPDLPIDLYPHLCNLMALQLSKSKTDVKQMQIWQSAIVENMRNAMAATPGERVKGQRAKMSLLRSGLIMGGRRFPRQVN